MTRGSAGSYVALFFAKRRHFNVPDARNGRQTLPATPARDSQTAAVGSQKVTNELLLLFPQRRALIGAWIRRDTPAA